jgi:hypothetical protein
MKIHVGFGFPNPGGTRSVTDDPRPVRSLIQDMTREIVKEIATPHRN